MRGEQEAGSGKNTLEREEPHHAGRREPKPMQVDSRRLEKKSTNIRAAGGDENILPTPPVELSLEQALAFIDEDELVEVTPRSIRIRKKWLRENQRRRAG